MSNHVELSNRRYVTLYKAYLDVSGAYIPQCDDNGFYSLMQCHSSVGQCWCVNKHGHEIRNTRTSGELDCSGASLFSLQDT